MSHGAHRLHCVKRQVSASQGMEPRDASDIDEELVRAGERERTSPTPYNS